MALGTIGFYSKALGKRMQFNILLPESGKPPFPVLYLLHGNSDDHTSWVASSTLAQRRVEGLMVVMPNGDRSRYVNSPLGRYEDYVARDLVEFVDRTFPTRADRAGRAIGGFSMGGYGAMMLGLKHHGLFSAISTHAGSYYHPGWIPRAGGWHETHPAREILSGICSLPGYDCRVLSQEALESGTPPAIRFDCGLEDPALECARGLDLHLKAIGLTHRFTEHPGRHDWPYVDSRLDESLQFIRASLGLE